MMKKDYELIASILKFYLQNEKSSECRCLIRAICRSMSIDFKSFNERFDQDKFLSACGMK